MKKYIFAAWVLVSLGCGSESLTSGPNPLETYDQARLGVLIHAAVNRGKAAECARYFQEADKQGEDNPDAALSAFLSQVCPESMVKIAAYLEHNGVAGVKAEHVKDVAFWERMKGQARVEGARLQQEQEERRRVGSAQKDRGEGRAGESADGTVIDFSGGAPSLADLGISLPEGMRADSPAEPPAC